MDKKNNTQEVNTSGSIMKNHTWNKKQITVTLVCCFIILGVVSAEAAYYAPISFLKPAEAYIEVHDTMTAGEIAAELQKKGIISNTWWFRAVATLTGTANTMKQGEYLVNNRMSLHDLMAKLVSGKSEAERIVIPEGYTVRRIAQVLDQKGLVKEADFLSAAADTKNLYPYMYGNRVVTFPSEGFLFPDTYFIPRGATADQIVKMMLDNFDKHLTENMRESADQHNMSIYQFVTLASMVEKEAQYEEDQPIIAAVFLKRLKINMPLQSDASLSYSLGSHKSAYSIEETKIDSPYNTYLYTGLPPGPIGNPGVNCLKAVAEVKDTEYLFFVADAKGHNHFSRTYEEHMQNVKEYMP